MELRVEADGRIGLPSDCIVSVCCGEVRKQAKYHPSKVFKFPAKQRHGKVDLYRRIGSCDIKIDTTVASSIVSRVVVEDPSLEGLRLRCLSSPLDAPSSKKLNKGSVKNETADVVKAYLDEHQISEMLEQAIKALLRERPEVPQKFLSDWILSGMDPMPIPHEFQEASLGSVGQKPQAPLPVVLSPVPPTSSKIGGNHPPASNARPSPGPVAQKPRNLPPLGSPTAPTAPKVASPTAPTAPKVNGNRPGSSGRRHVATEEAELRRIFEMCDVNKTGSIDKRELIKALRKHKEVAEFFHLPETIRQEDGSRDAMEAFFQGADTNDDREMSWDELKAFWMKHHGAATAATDSAAPSNAIEDHALKALPALVT